MEKVCISCNLLKSIDQYYFSIGCKDGHINQCKSCISKHNKIYRSTSKNYKERRNAYSKEYSKLHPEKKKRNCSNYILNNPEKRSESIRKYAKNNPEKVKESNKKWRIKNPNHAKNYMKMKRDININFKLLSILRHRLYLSLKAQKTQKRNSIQALIGCSIPELKIYLESKFLPTMSWKNYGRYWHVDHMIPCAEFDLSIEEEQKQCFHYTNLQPLFAVTQIINGIEYIGNLNKNAKILKYGT